MTCSIGCSRTPRSPNEAAALGATADQWGLSMDDVVAALHAGLEALRHDAVADGRITTPVDVTSTRAKPLTTLASTGKAS